MSKTIKADHSQILLLPPSVEEWVPINHPARFIREFVNGLDMKALEFKVNKSIDTGRPGYSPELMLSVWLYGYFQRVYSSRKLEFACKNEMALIWLTGMNYPDHNSLWRFWKEYKPQIKKIFKETVLVADKMDMVGMVLQAIDGTKIQTVSSRRSMWSKANLSKKLEIIDAQIVELEKEIDLQEGSSTSSLNLPEKLHDAKNLRASIKEAKTYLEKEGLTNFHPMESEARMMKNQRVVEPCYNAQIAVDSKHQIITAETVVNKENDTAMLIPMLEKAKENLGKVAAENLADSGYNTEKSIQEAADSNFEVLVNDPKRRAIKEDEFHSAHFAFHPDGDKVICPKGTELKFEREKKGKPGQGKIKLFRCKNKECPFLALCTRDRRGRAVEISLQRLAVQNQNQKRENKEGRELLKKRGVIVEPVFAFIKINRGFKRFTFKTLEKAGIQWSFHCAIHNLKKIFQNWNPLMKTEIPQVA